MSHRGPIPVAIVGIGCRFPGDATDPEKFWTILQEGRNVWSDVPSNRFNAQSYYHPDPDFSGGNNHRGGHFLKEDISRFDAEFFGISAAEARCMDPQQRLQLETTFEAFQSAGFSMEQVRGSNTGVYVATFTRDYDRILYRDPSNIPKYQTTGTGDAILANRISYLFNLKGASITMDTGCSGSLVALHLACQSLRTFETDMAVVGGVNLILSSEQMVGMSSFQ
jgi:acyl transferase domain-containing protein